MKKKMHFEDAMQRLEEIVSRLEAGNVPLEESIKLYEEGMKLGKLCRSMLNEAELKVRKLAQDIEDDAQEEEDSE